jgi:hypothetical protein
MPKDTDTLSPAGLPLNLANAAEVVLNQWSDNKDCQLSVEDVLRHLHLAPSNSAVTSLRPGPQAGRDVVRSETDARLREMQCGPD